jgi:hypothetical protein
LSNDSPGPLSGLGGCLVRHRRFWNVALVVPPLAVLAALAFSPLGRFQGSTLVIEARTPEKGTGSVAVETAGTGETTRVRFKIMHRDQGEATLSISELPAVVPASLTIAFPAGAGNAKVDRLTLANDAVSYDWFDLENCSRKAKVNGVVRRELCGAGPTLVRAADGTIRISSIPEEGFAAGSGFTYVFALGVLLAAGLCGAWLARPVREAGLRGFIDYGGRASWLALAALAVFQFLMVVRNAVDVPFIDEWDYFAAHGLSRDLNWSWLFGFNNEHRIVLTKMLAWINFRMFGLDFALQKILNFLLYCGLLVVIGRFRKQVKGAEGFTLYPVFLVFLLSPLAVENHLWAFQSQFHLVLLFSVLALPYVCAEERNGAGTAAFCLFLVLAMFTVSAGLFIAGVYLACAVVFTAAQALGKRLDRRAGWRFVLVSSAVIVVGMVLARWGNVPNGWPPRVYPHEPLFWESFLNIVSFSFGFRQLSLLPGLACLLLALTPLVLLLRDPHTRWRPATWHLMAGILGILAVLAAISVARAYFAAPKISRYTEIGFMLIPYLALAWWLALRPGRVRTTVLSLVWLFCAAASWDDWSTDVWPIERQNDLVTLECVEAYYGWNGDGACQDRVTPAKLDRARQLGVRFTRQFSASPGASR